MQICVWEHCTWHRSLVQSSKEQRLHQQALLRMCEPVNTLRLVKAHVKAKAWKIDFQA